MFKMEFVTAMVVNGWLVLKSIICIELIQLFNYYCLILFPNFRIKKNVLINKCPKMLSSLSINNLFVLIGHLLS